MYALITLLSITIPLYCVYQLGSLAGLFSERSGVANVAIEGNMIVGAVTFSLLQQTLVVNLSPLPALIISIIITIPVAALFMLLLSVLTNRYFADHIIGGTAMNLLAPALMTMLYLVLSTEVSLDGGSPDWSGNIQPMINEWIWHIHIGDQTVNTFNWVYVAFLIATVLIVFVSMFTINKTKFGLRLRTSGENPYALETSGVSVLKTRRMALYIAGMLSSFAGIAFAVKGSFFFTVKGSGFLAIGILILGQYRVIGTVIGSLVLAFFIGSVETLEFIKGTSDMMFVQNVNLLKAIPYLIPLLGLVFLKTSYTPKAVGTNFKKDQR